MTRCVALLRAVNLGLHNKVSIARLALSPAQQRVARRVGHHLDDVEDARGPIAEQPCTPAARRGGQCAWGVAGWRRLCFGVLAHVVITMRWGGGIQSKHRKCRFELRVASHRGWRLSTGSCHPTDPLRNR